MGTATLRISRTHWETMAHDAQTRIPEEACGLVAGRDGRAVAVFPVENALHSPVRFRMPGAEQLRLFQLFEANGWDLLAIYHSHPGGPPFPSPTDVAEAGYPEALMVIWSPNAAPRPPILGERGAGGGWGCRAFLVQEGQVREADVVVD